MTDPVTDSQPWQRLSVGMLFVQPVRELIRALPLLIALVFAGHASGSQPPWSLIGVGVLVALGISRWLTTRYRITASVVQVRKGLLARKTITVPRDRVRTVDVSAHPLQRVLGLVKVEIGTGTSDRKAPPLTLDGLAGKRASTLRAELLHRAPAAGDDTRVGTAAGDLQVATIDNETELVGFDPRWIRFAPATLSGAVTALFLIGLGWRITGEAHLHPDRISAVRAGIDHVTRTALWLDVLEIGLAAAVLVTLLSVFGYALAFWGFRLTRHAGGSLHVSRGLLTTRATSVELRRIRGVERSEPLLLRLAGGSRCLAIATGLRVGRGSERGGSLLVPPAPREQSVRVETAVLGSAVPAAATLVPRTSTALRRRLTRALGVTVVVVSAVVVWSWLGSLPAWVALGSLALLPISAWIASDRYRNLGHALVTAPGSTGGRWLVTRYGSLVRRRCTLSVDGVIGVTLRQSYFQRRAALTTLTVTTAAGRQHYPVSDLVTGAAAGLAGELLPVVGEFVDHAGPGRSGGAAAAVGAVEPALASPS